MILTRIGILSSSGSTASPYDTIVQNYASLSGATVSESDAISAYLKQDVVDKLIAVYVFVGDGLLSKLYNLLDPADLDGAFRGKLTNSGTNHAKGLSLLDTTQKMVTFVDPALISNHETIGVTWYTQRGISTQHILTADKNGANSAQGVNIEPHWPGDHNAYINIWTGTGGIPGSSAHIGFNNAQRADANTLQYYQGTSLLQRTDAAVNNYSSSDKFIVIQGDNDGSAIVYSYFAVHKAFDSTEEEKHRTAVENLMTALGRNA